MAAPQFNPRDALAKACKQIESTPRKKCAEVLGNASRSLALQGAEVEACIPDLISACTKSGLLPYESKAYVEMLIRNGFATVAKSTGHDNVIPIAQPLRSTVTTLETKTASAFKPRGIRWLWKNRFALGKLGLIGGMPDKGKGLISADLIACVTADHPFPCSEGTAPQGSVVYFTAEDDLEDTVVPRLLAAGANLDRVHIVQCSRERDGRERTFSMVTDLEALRSKLEQLGDVVMVIIDPMSAYVGVGKVNNSMTTDVRGFLKPLTDLASEKGVSVIGIMHFNKKVDVANAMLRIADSLAYVAAARHVYFVVDDPETEKQRLFVEAKNNLAPDVKALSYTIGLRSVGKDPDNDQEIFAPYVLWGAKHVEISASEAMQAEAGGAKGRSERREAKEFLLDQLADGPRAQHELVLEAEASGTPWVGQNPPGMVT